MAGSQRALNQGKGWAPPQQPPPLVPDLGSEQQAIEIPL
jgi:hypothetical protein